MMRMWFGLEIDVVGLPPLPEELPEGRYSERPPPTQSKYELDFFIK